MARPLATPCNPQPAIRRRFFFGRCIMSDALKRAEHYHDLARRYLRLAESTENPNHYLRIAVQYNALAEAKELSISHGDGDWPFDRFGLMDGVIVPAPSEGPSILASPRLAPMVISDFCPRPRRTGIGLGH